MNSADRLAAAFELQRPDRPPILGGWLAAPGHIQALAGCSEDAYWADPFAWSVEAERVLGSDGVITIFVPVKRGAYRCVDHDVRARRATHTVDSLLADIAALPEPDAVRASFDLETAYADFARELRERQARCGEIAWLPADWHMIPRTIWGPEFGYDTALTTLGLHPEAWRKLVRHSAETGRQRAALHARAIREGLRPRAILTGEDICSQNGPMVSPAYLRREYLPLLEYCFEPLLAVGAKIIWHCDGNYRPILNDILSTGVAGLQGFQRECGMDLAWIVKRRTRTGAPLIIFGPMSVTETLPHGTPADVRLAVQDAMQVCRDDASLVFFTSNTITPDCPLANVRAFWDAVRQSRW